jgi:hydroxypyruvate isomerase
LAAAAPAGEPGPFASVPLRMAPPYGWFEGEPDDRFAQIRAWGFGAYEWLGPDGDIPALRAAMDRHGLALTCIVGAGSIAPGGMVNPADHDKLEEQFIGRVALAKQLGTTRLIGLTGNTRDDVSMEEQRDHVVTCCKRLAPIAEAEGVTLILEALNPLVDHAGFFLTTTAQTMDILGRVDSPNVKMLFDIYHQQITEGNVIRNLTGNVGRIGHFHVADNPGRREPGTGELNYARIFEALAATDYDGYVALECGHSGTVEEALKAVLRCFDDPAGVARA